ncbi:molybdopterin converting factor subunit 1 [Halobacillus fulvus]|nr:molybdopterin converting factor subunit 1 [Halobacillus fulvus]
MNQLLFFAELKDKVGSESVKLDVSGKTVLEVKSMVNDTYGVNKISESMVAINEEFVTKETIIQKNDTIAFIPPVSGG